MVYECLDLFFLPQHCVCESHPILSVAINLFIIINDSIPLHHNSSVLLMDMGCCLCGWLPCGWPLRVILVGRFLHTQTSAYVCTCKVFLRKWSLGVEFTSQGMKNFHFSTGCQMVFYSRGTSCPCVSSMWEFGNSSSLLRSWFWPLHGRKPPLTLKVWMQGAPHLYSFSTCAYLTITLKVLCSMPMTGMKRCCSDPLDPLLH